jgi:predicted DNA-binding transcriptional regulator AlpA
MDSRNERLVSFLKNTGFSIPEIVVKCGIEKSKRTIYKIVNEGHKPSPRILRAIKEQFPELDIPYILTGKSRAVRYMLSEVDKEEEEYNRPAFSGDLEMLFDRMNLLEKKVRVLEAKLNESSK